MRQTASACGSSKHVSSSTLFLVEGKRESGGCEQNVVGGSRSGEGGPVIHGVAEGVVAVRRELLGVGVYLGIHVHRRDADTDDRTSRDAVLAEMCVLGSDSCDECGRCEAAEPLKDSPFDQPQLANVTRHRAVRPDDSRDLGGKAFLQRGCQ